MKRKKAEQQIFIEQKLSSPKDDGHGLQLG
jgi:hypothetical protein